MLLSPAVAGHCLRIRGPRLYAQGFLTPWAKDQGLINFAVLETGLCNHHF